MGILDRFFPAQAKKIADQAAAVAREEVIQQARQEFSVIRAAMPAARVTLVLLLVSATEKISDPELWPRMFRQIFL